jgi:hypothetical protein
LPLRPLRSRLVSGNVTQAEFDRRRLLLLIWLYLGLLLTEGALRKWFLPSLSNPLLLVRDPIAIFIVALGFRSRNLVFDSYLRSLFLLLAGFVAIGGLQMINGVGGSPLVIGYGLRTYLLHLPVAFVMARVLNGGDIRRMLILFLAAAVPMALLMAVQFESSPEAWINLGVAGHKGQIFAASGRIRPAGTFSFVNGPIGFFSIALAGLIASHVDIRGFGWPLRLAGWTGVALAASVSGSRSFVAAMAGVALAGLAGWAKSRSAAFSRGMVVAGITAVLIVNVLGSFDTVQEGTQVIQGRFDQFASGGLSSRLTYDVQTVQWAMLDAPPLGVGLGAGTNAASAYQGASVFRWGEGEWPRVIFEAGPILGLLYLGWRVWLTVAVGRAALRASGAGALLPLLLWGACAMSIFMGQWGQTSIQGFSVFTLGLSLAAGRSAMQERAAAARAPQPPAWVLRRAAGLARG